VAGVALLALGVAIGNGTATVVAGSAAIAWAVLELVLVRWSFRRGQRRAWAALSETGLHTMTFSEKGISINTRQTTAINSWDVYSEALEREGIYLLRLGRLKTLPVYLYVPKRAFKSVEEEELFCRLVAEHTKTTFDVRRQGRSGPDETAAR
jgi:hypothetical protein